MRGLRRRAKLPINEIIQIYIDTKWLAVNDTDGRKRETERPLSYDDVRLVVAWQKPDGTRKDVIIDKVHMERHSTGINPFTGDHAGVDPETGKPIVVDTDPETGEAIYAETAIPEEQSVDPQTGDPLYHRYVGFGSHFQRIPWPWELDEYKKKKEGQAEDLIEEEDKGFFKRTAGKVQTLFRRRGKEAPKPVEEEDEPEEAPTSLERKPPIPPREDDPADYDDDTSLNVVEIGLGNFDNEGHFVPTMVTPPMPKSVCRELEELQLDKEESQWAERGKQHHREAANEAAVVNEAPAPKTPLQEVNPLTTAYFACSITIRLIYPSGRSDVLECL